MGSWKLNKMVTDQQKTKLNEIIGAANEMISRVGKRVVFAKEAEDFFAENKRSALGLFDSTTDEWRILDRWETENGYKWSLMQRSGVYADEKQIEKLNKLAEVLRSINGVVVTTSDETEKHFTSSEAYEARRFVCDILRQAGAKVMIVDEWLDDKFFEYVDIIPGNVSICAITGERYPIFWTLYGDLKKKGVNIEARVNGVSHCRYIVVDDTIFYSTDASLNTIGKKDFMIHKLQDAVQIAKVKTEIEQYWNNAKIK